MSVLVLGCALTPLLLNWPFGPISWRAAGLASAWLGSGLLLASLLLMQREVHLAQWLGGLARMYLWHHRLAVAAYLCLLAHPLLLAAAQQPLAQAWNWLWPAAGSAWALLLWSGWLALGGFMLGLAAALLPDAWLKYERWRRLHAVLGLAVLASAWHVWLLDALWLALLLLALLLWRVLRADVGLAARDGVVTAVVPLASDAVEVSLRLVRQQPPARSLQPGQFVLVAFLRGAGFEGCGEYHPFTVSGVGAAGELRLGIKALGNCTRGMQALRAQVPLRLQGPFGSFLPVQHAGPSLWLAGGIGITPFMAALRSAPPQAPVHLLYLHRDATDAAYVEELRQLAAQSAQLSLQIVASGADLPDLASLLPAAQDLQPTALGAWRCWLCGPPGLIASARQLLQARGLAAAQIHFEHFDFR